MFPWECQCNCHYLDNDTILHHTFPCCSRCSKCGMYVKRCQESLHTDDCRKIVMENTENVNQFTPEERAVVDEAKDLMEKVLKRIEQSTHKYGANYVLANVMKETDEELLDIVGWPLLEVIRMRQLFMNKLGQLDGKYLDKFLKVQTLEYLLHLKAKIGAELIKRQ